MMQLALMMKANEANGANVELKKPADFYQRALKFVVPTEGLEPPHPKTHGPEPCASTNSATWATEGVIIEYLTGFGEIFRRKFRMMVQAGRKSSAAWAGSAGSGDFLLILAKLNTWNVPNVKFEVELKKPADFHQRALKFWCPRRDSNPHTRRHMDLNHARLPIPPRGQRRTTL